MVEGCPIGVGWRSSEVGDKDGGGGGAGIVVVVGIRGHLAPMVDCLLLRLVAAVDGVV